MILANERRYGTAQEIAAALGGDVTPTMVRNWARRDGLASVRVSRTVYFDLAKAAQVERDKRTSGRGRPRRLDDPAKIAA